jgi:hypothetical protein
MWTMLRRRRTSAFNATATKTFQVVIYWPCPLLNAGLNCVESALASIDAEDARLSVLDDVAVGDDIDADPTRFAEWNRNQKP